MPKHIYNTTSYSSIPLDKPDINARTHTYLISLSEVENRTSLKKSTIYGMIQTGLFPRPVKVTGSRSAWPACEIQEWINEKKLEREFTPVASTQNGRHSNV